MTAHDAPVTIVAGLGRSGTGLLARVMDSGGASVCGDPPSYEDDTLVHQGGEPDWQSLRGDTVVIIDPLYYSGLLPEEVAVKWIWTRGSLTAQAKGILKHQGLRRRERDVEPLSDHLCLRGWDTWSMIEKRGESVLKVDVSDLMNHTQSICRSISRFVEWEGSDPDIESMVDEAHSSSGSGGSPGEMHRAALERRVQGAKDLLQLQRELQST